MITDNAKSRSLVAQPPKSKSAWVASSVLILALILGAFGAVPGVVVAAHEADSADPLLGAVGLEVFPHSSITLGGLSDVDPLLGAVLLGPEKMEIGWGIAIAQRIVADVDPLLGGVGLNVSPGNSVALGVSDLDPLLGVVGLEIHPGSSIILGLSDVDPLLGAAGLEIGPGSFVALSSGSDADLLQCTLGPQVDPGSSIALVGVSGLDPLLGAVGLEIDSGSSIALAQGVLCSNWDLYPLAPV